MKHFLFICGKNQLRSPTAENVFSEYENIEVRSAGVDNDAEHLVDPDDIEWAEYIFLMEQIHKEKLMKRYGDYIKSQKVIVLDIVDKYEYMDEELIQILKQKVKKYLPTNVRSLDR